jgi:hypothetical protein
MKKLVRDHRTIGVEIARSEIQLNGNLIPLVLYQTEPEGLPRAMFGNSSIVSVEEDEAKKYLVNQLFQVMTQALYFGLPAAILQELTSEALTKSERYLNSLADEKQQVSIG